MNNQLLELGILGTFVLASFKYLIEDKNKRELKQEQREELLEERMRLKEDERATAYISIFKEIQDSHKEDRVVFKDSIKIMEIQNAKMVEMIIKNNEDQASTLNRLNTSLKEISTQITNLNKKSDDLEKDLQDIKEIVVIKGNLKKH